MKTYPVYVSDGQNDYRFDCKATTDRGIIKSAVKHWPYVNPLKLNIKAYVDGTDMLPLEFTYYA